MIQKFAAAALALSMAYTAQAAVNTTRTVVQAVAK